MSKNATEAAGIPKEHAVWDPRGCRCAIGAILVPGSVSGSQLEPTDMISCMHSACQAGEGGSALMSGTAMVPAVACPDRRGHCAHPDFLVSLAEPRAP